MPTAKDTYFRRKQNDLLQNKSHQYLFDTPDSGQNLEHDALAMGLVSL